MFVHGLILNPRFGILVHHQLYIMSSFDASCVGESPVTSRLVGNGEVEVLIASGGSPRPDQLPVCALTAPSGTSKGRRPEASGLPIGWGLFRPARTDKKCRWAPHRCACAVLVRWPVAPPRGRVHNGAHDAQLLFDVSLLQLLQLHPRTGVGRVQGDGLTITFNGLLSAAGDRQGLA